LKKVLITGANSYVGTNVEKWLMREPDKYYIETLDMKDPNWKNFDFSKFDVVFHVAGIAHIKERKSNKKLYYKVNRDLAIESATLAKKTGVKHFIFMSSMSVFGIEQGQIGESTVPNPKSIYGKSKYQAENCIIKMMNLSFKVSIIRPPMIYGPNSSGNFIRLSNIAKKVSIYPNIKNKRSAIFIDNFSNFVKKIVDNSITGYLHPQNDEYINTTELITTIRQINGLKTYNLRSLNWVIHILMIMFKSFKKLYGSLTYERSLSQDYCIIDFKSSIKISENPEQVK